LSERVHESNLVLSYKSLGQSASSSCSLRRIGAVHCESAKSWLAKPAGSIVNHRMTVDPFRAMTSETKISSPQLPDDRASRFPSKRCLVSIFKASWAQYLAGIQSRPETDRWIRADQRHPTNIGATRIRLLEDSSSRECRF